MANLLKKLRKDSATSEPILFYTDKASIADWDRQFTPILQVGCNLINAWKEVVGREIGSVEELIELAENPAASFRTEYEQTNREQLAERLGVLIETLDLSTLIKLPDGFDRIVTAAKEFRRHFEHCNPKYFDIENDKLVISSEGIERRNRSVYCFAVTDEEKLRLQVSLQIIEALERMAEVVPNAASTAGQNAIKEKRYAHPLPLPVQIVHDENGTHLVPSVSWVAEGFGGSAVLGYYVPTTREHKLAIEQHRPKLGPRFRKIVKVDANGFQTSEVYLVIEGENPERYMLGEFRMHRNILLDGWFNQEGKPHGTPLTPDTIPADKRVSFAEKFLASIKD